MNNIGLKKVTFYLIRHVKTRRIMPQAKKDKGYSHWNPSSGEIFVQGLNIPRLFNSKRSAQRAIIGWFVYPNGRYHSYQNSYTGEYDEDIVTKNDGRKKEDLEIIKVRIQKEK